MIECVMSSLDVASVSSPKIRLLYRMMMTMNDSGDEYYDNDEVE